MVAQLKHTENHLTVHMNGVLCGMRTVSQKSCFKKEVTNTEESAPSPRPSGLSLRVGLTIPRHRHGGRKGADEVAAPAAAAPCGASHVLGPGCAPATCHVGRPSIKAWPRFGSTSQHPIPAHRYSLPASTSSHWDHTAASSRAPAATFPLCTPVSTRWSGGSAKTY